jgi:hypothetical protein
MLLLLAAISTFSPKACQRFCERQGYDFCVPIRTDKQAYYCADRIQKSGIRELIWTTRWAPGSAPIPEAPAEEREDPFPRYNF